MEIVKKEAKGMNRQQSLGGGARGFVPLKGKKLDHLQTDQNNVIMNNKFSKREVSMKNSFTLAEVLITLGVIGIVAALTLPTLIQKQQEKEKIVALKKAYSVISNAYLRAFDEYGPLNDWQQDDEKLGYAIFRVMSKYIKNVKICQPGDTSKACVLRDLKNLNGTRFKPEATSKNDIVMILPDGINLYFNDGDSWIGADVNANKAPNQWGIDVFAFRLDRSKPVVKPMGYHNPGGTGETFEVDCADGTSTLGHACTGWVIAHENMDYLRCPGKLGWDKAHSCKEAKK